MPQYQIMVTAQADGQVFTNQQIFRCEDPATFRNVMVQIFDCDSGKLVMGPTIEVDTMAEKERSFVFPSKDTYEQFEAYFPEGWKLVGQHIASEHLVFDTPTGERRVSYLDAERILKDPEAVADVFNDRKAAVEATRRKREARNSEI